jgi:hypothetical protein
VIERDLEHTPIRAGEQRARRSLEPEALDEPEERLAGDGAEDAVKVKRRERRHLGQGRERQLLAEVLADVIDDPVDPPLVLPTIGVSDRAPPSVSPG